MDRLDIIREHLNAPFKTVWAEPFYDAWRAGEGLDERIRFAQAQAAEMASVKPFIKHGELIIGNNALCSILTGLPTPFRTGIRCEDWYQGTLINDHPESESKITEIKSFWNEWSRENVTPMTCHASLAYERILTMGISGMREYVKHWREINVASRPHCAAWYDALLIVLDGISAFIKAHATVAEDATITEDDPDRCRELKLIAQSCYNISVNPPQSFYEAVQLFYFTFWLCGGHDSPGPIDRYLYPSLIKDLDNEVISYQQAQEIIDCLWLKFEEKTAYGATIGGQLRDGSDASNELSLMCVS